MFSSVEEGPFFLDAFHLPHCVSLFQQAVLENAE